MAAGRKGKHRGSPGPDPRPACSLRTPAARGTCLGSPAPLRCGLKPRPRIQSPPGTRSRPGRHLPGPPGRLYPWATAAHQGRDAAGGKAGSPQRKPVTSQPTTGAKHYAEAAGSEPPRTERKRAAGRERLTCAAVACSRRPLLAGGPHCTPPPPACFSQWRKFVKFHT